MPSKTAPPSVQSTWPPLHAAIWRAAWDDDLSQLKAMLQKAVDIREVSDGHGSTNSTVLHTASSGSVELLELLMDHGAEALLEVQCGPGEEGRWSGSTPLQMAAKRGCREFARRLVEFGAGYDVFSAIALGDTERVSQLVEHDKRQLNIRDDYQATLLHWAAGHDQHDAAKFLIKHGANVDAVDSFDETPLLVASVRQSQLRRETAGAGKTISLVEFLLNLAATVDVHAAAALGDNNGLEQLLDNERRLAVLKNSHGTTPLHWAARNVHIAAAQLLLDSGADIDAMDEIGCPPLWYAAYWGGDAEMVEFLCQRRANVSFRNIWDKDISAYDIGRENYSVITAYQK